MSDNPIGRDEPPPTPPGTKRSRGRYRSDSSAHRGLPRDAQQRNLQVAIREEIRDREDEYALATKSEDAIEKYGSQVEAASYLGQKYARDVLNIIGVGAVRGQKHALTLFARIMGWSSQGIKYQTLVLQNIGAMSMDEAKKAMEFHREIENVDMDQAFEKACEMIRAYLMKKPDRVPFAKRLTGL